MTKKDLNFTGLFGQCEMEEAAKRIVIVTAMCQDTPVRLDDFRTSLETEGFLYMQELGWMKPALDKPRGASGYFSPTAEFWDRVKSRINKQ